MMKVLRWCTMVFGRCAMLVVWKKRFGWRAGSVKSVGSERLKVDSLEIES